MILPNTRKDYQMKNKDKLKVVSKNHARYAILFYGVFNGVAKLSSGKMVLVTLTNIASLQDKNILELYKICA